MKDTIKFGLEIEYRNATASSVQKKLREAGITSTIEGYHSSTNFDNWKITYDSTVASGRGRSMRGGELVSPILTVDRISEIDAVVNAIKLANGSVDRRCGLHVHISWENMEEDTVRSILKRYAKFEKQIDAFMPSSRRDNNNNYCRSVVGFDITESVGYATRRESKVNTTSMRGYSRINTIEFRHHSGTLSAFKIKNWILFLMDFVAESDKKKSGSIMERTFVSETDVSMEEKKKAYGRMKKAMAHFGIELKQKRGFGFSFTATRTTRDGNTATMAPITKTLTYDEVSNLHISGTRKLDDDKLYEFLSTLLDADFEADSLFTGVCDKLEYYFLGRSDLLNERIA